MKNILLACITCSIFLLAACPKKSEVGFFKGSMRQDKTTVSPKGVRINSGERIDPRWGETVDAGLDDLFKAARAAIANYPATDRHSRYTVWLFPRSPKCRVASFLAYGPPAWDQTEFDRDDRPGHITMCVAGFMVRPGVAQGNLYGSPGMVIVDDLAIGRNVVRYEGEHNEILDFAPGWYQQTTDVHDHPILPDPQSVNPDLTPLTIESDRAFTITTESGEVLARIGQSERVRVLVTK